MSWTLKNDKSVSSSSNPATLPAFSNALTNPSLIIVTVQFNADTAISTPTDTAGNTYYDCGAGQIAYSASTKSLQIFYALNTHTTASNVISIANSSGNYLRVEASEWTGGATASPVDVHASNANANTGTGGGQNMTSDSATTTVAGDLVIGMGAASGTVSAGTGFTALSTSETYDAPEYQVQSAAGSIAATWSDTTNSDSYGAVMACFKPATAFAPDEDFWQGSLAQSSDAAVTVWG